MKKIELSLTDDLYRQLKELHQQIEVLEFEDFLIAILQNYVDDQNPDQKAERDKEVEQRLKNLGYL